jgi:hypothetical protein
MDRHRILAWCSTWLSPGPRRRWAVKKNGIEAIVSVARGGSMLPNNQSLSDILCHSPEKILAWVQQHSAAIDGSQDWQGLAYETSSRVAVDSKLTDDEYAALATAAVLLYDRLGDTCPNASDRSNSRENAMGGGLS